MDGRNSGDEQTVAQDNAFKEENSTISERVIEMSDATDVIKSRCKVLLGKNMYAVILMKVL